MSDETNNFFCRPLPEGATFAGQFTSIVSMIACGLAFSVFFKESAETDGDSKLVSFLVACFNIFYIAMSRALIRGIKEERRNKFVCWIAMSIVSVILLYSGVIFALTLFAMGRFQESLLMTFAVVIGLVLCIAVSAVLFLYKEYLPDVQ